MNARNTMASRVEAYLSARQQAGFALRAIGSRLRSFARFADGGGHRGPLTVHLAIRWAQASRRPKPLTAAGRIALLHPFARFCQQQFDPATEIPHPQLLGPGYRRVTPHLYSQQEIHSLLEAASRCAPPNRLRSAALSTLFGLLAATGMRVSEALLLHRSDVDLQLGLLHLRDTKRHKARYVPLHPTTTQALRRYAQCRHRAVPNPKQPAFFFAHPNRPLSLGAAQRAFNRLRKQLGWHSRGGHPAPRIHDLRHTFVCQRLARWYEEGLDIDAAILSLSTYIGHANVTSTYWYLTATPELMAIAAVRFKHFAQGAGAS